MHWGSVSVLAAVLMLCIGNGVSAQNVRIGVLWGDAGSEVERAVQIAVQTYQKIMKPTWTATPVASYITNEADSAVGGLCGLLSQGGLIGIVGPRTSSAALFAGFHASLHQIPLISPTSSVAYHSEPEGASLEYVRRTAPTNSALAKAFPHFLKNIPALASAPIAILHAQTQYGEDLSGRIRDSLHDNNLNVRVMQALDSGATSYDAIFESLREKYIEVVILLAGTDLSTKVLRGALASSPAAFGLGRAWIVPDSVTNYPLPDDVKHRLHGLLGVRAALQTSRNYHELASNWCPSSSAQSCTFEPSWAARFAFDAAWALLQAAAETHAYTSPSPAKHCEATGDKWVTGKDMLAALDRMNFAGGAATNIRLNPGADHFGFEFVNLQASVGGQVSWREVGVFVPPSDVNVAAQEAITWPGGKALSADQVLIGRHLQILFIEFAPFVQKSNSSVLRGGEKIEGFVVDMIEELSKRLDFTYTAHVTVGGWTPGITAVSQKKYDMQAGDTSITRVREEIVDFTLPYMETHSVLLVTAPVKENNLFRFTTPFTIDLWLLIFGVVVFCGFALWLLEDKLAPKELVERGGVGPYVAPKGKYSQENSLWFSCTAFIGVQGGEPLSIAGRVFSLGLFWLSVIVIATYTAELAAFLARRSPKYKVDSIDEFISGKYSPSKLAVSENTVNDFWMEKQPSLRGKYKKMAVEVEMAKLTKEETLLASVQETTWTEWFVQQADDDGVCHFETRGNPWNPRGVGLALQKNSPYTSVLSENILFMRESGDLENMKRKWFVGNCSSKAGDSDEDESLQIADFGGVLLLYGGLVFLAVLLRIGKILWVKGRSSKKGAVLLPEPADSLAKPSTQPVPAEARTDRSLSVPPAPPLDNIADPTDVVYNPSLPLPRPMPAGRHRYSATGSPYAAPHFVRQPREAAYHTSRGSPYPY